MDKQDKIAIIEFLQIKIENSEIYDTEAYKKLEKELCRYWNIMEKSLDESIFSEYRETRIDMETLFYRFGFIEGIKFFQSLQNTSSKEIIDELTKSE